MKWLVSARALNKLDQRGNTSTEYAMLLSLGLMVIMPIVTMMQSTQDSLGEYAAALCGGGSDSTTGTTDDNCWKAYLNSLGGSSPTSGGKKIEDAKKSSSEETKEN